MIIQLDVGALEPDERKSVYINLLFLKNYKIKTKDEPKDDLTFKEIQAYRLNTKTKEISCHSNYIIGYDIMNISVDF